jgi:hypothetical protein
MESGNLHFDAGLPSFYQLRQEKGLFHIIVLISGPLATAHSVPLLLQNTHFSFCHIGVFPSL